MPIISGGGSFSGGTLTQPLTVKADSASALVVERSDSTEQWGIDTTAGASEVFCTVTNLGDNMVRLVSPGAQFLVSTDGNITAIGEGGNSQWIIAQESGSPHVVSLKTDAGVEIYPSGGTPLVVKKPTDGTAILSVDAAGHVIVGAIPTSDPGVSGALYSVAGVVHVSP